MVVPELDEQLRGTRPGAILEFDATLPERFGDRAGEDATFRVIVKEAKHKVLPELTDEWVDEASEFDTVDELRADIRKRLEMVQKLAGADGACATRCSKRSPTSCRSTRPTCSSTTRRAAASKTSTTACRTRTRRSTTTSQATGQEPQAFVDEVREGAAKAVLADLALRAVVAQEEIEATDEEVDAEIVRLAERMEQKPEKVRRDLEEAGRAGDGTL